MLRKVYIFAIYIFIIIAARSLIAKDSGRENNPNNFLTFASTATQDSTSTEASFLKQNYPNPFNPTTTIVFYLPVRSQVELNVYNVLGVKLQTLIQGVKEAGSYSVRFDASKYPSGIYIYELQTDKFKQTKKMIYVK